MKIDIILSGVGGQGILSIAGVIGRAAMGNGLNIKQAEVHGMSQRGGDVQSNLRISDTTIYSDLIPLGQAELILSLEPMESLRYLPYLSPKGWLVTNSAAFINIPNYPKEEEIRSEIEKTANHIIIDVEAIAKEVGSLRVSNMVLLGAATPFLNIDVNKIEQAIIDLFSKKGEAIVELNIKALRAGREAAQKNK